MLNVARAASTSALMMPRRSWAMGWRGGRRAPSLVGYSSTRPAAALPTMLWRIGLTVPTKVRGSAMVSARAGVTRTLGAGGAPDLPLGAWACAAEIAVRRIKSEVAVLIAKYKLRTSNLEFG